MPGLRGLPLAEALRSELGPIPILFVSGFADHALEGELGPDTGFLPKPRSYRRSGRTASAEAAARATMKRREPT